MTTLLYPDLTTLHVVDDDCVVADMDAHGYSATYCVYGIDPDGDEWQWFEYHTYDFDADEWLPVDVRGLERIA